MNNENKGSLSVIEKGTKGSNVFVVARLMMRARIPSL